MARKKQQATLQSSATYIVEIQDWDWSYSFGVNAARYDERPYSDYRHMLVTGKILLPTRLQVKAEAAEADIHA